MKKTDALSPTKTVEFATPFYCHKKTISGAALIEHCLKVSEQAEIIAAQLYQDVRMDFFPESTKESIAAIVQGAILHDILHVSECAFEQIAEATTVQVAAMVADVTRDFRLVETKRDMEFRGRLSQSPVSSQIVVTADIICTAKELLALLNVHGIKLVPKAKKILTQLDGDLLAIHAASRYYMLRQYVHAARGLLNQISQKIKACKQQARMDRIVANSTKSIRDAQLKEKPAKTAPKKKKEVRYARKRTTGTDPA